MNVWASRPYEPAARRIEQDNDKKKTSRGFCIDSLDAGIRLCYGCFRDKAGHDCCASVSGAFLRGIPYLRTKVCDDHAGTDNGLFSGLLREDEVVRFAAAESGSAQRYRRGGAAIVCNDRAYPKRRSSS